MAASPDTPRFTAEDAEALVRELEQHPWTSLSYVGEEPWACRCGARGIGGEAGHRRHRAEVIVARLAALAPPQGPEQEQKALPEELDRAGEVLAGEPEHTLSDVRTRERIATRLLDVERGRAVSTDAYGADVVFLLNEISRLRQKLVGISEALGYDPSWIDIAPCNVVAHTVKDMADNLNRRLSAQPSLSSPSAGRKEEPGLCCDVSPTGVLGAQAICNLPKGHDGAHREKTSVTLFVWERAVRGKDAP